MNKFTFKELTEEEFKPIWDTYRKDVFSSDHSYPFWELMTDGEKQNIKNLGKGQGERIDIRLVAFDDGGNIAGWSWGFQENRVNFYMANSAVLPKYRRMGLYSKMVEYMIRKAKDFGFQLLYSKHCATNNSVIIPKLKAGFTISKMEIDDVFGVLIHLHYYYNETRRKMMDYRCGQTAPDEDIKKLLGL